MNLDKECTDLKNAVEGLGAGTETFEIDHGFQFTHADVIHDLKLCLRDLNILNASIKEKGNTLELLDKVKEMAADILYIQMKCHIRCLSSVLADLQEYPEKAGLYKLLIHVDYSGTKRWIKPEELNRVQQLQSDQIQFWVSQGFPREDVEEMFYLKILENEE